jgi:hypothetical protein
LTPAGIWDPYDEDQLMTKKSRNKTATSLFRGMRVRVHVVEDIAIPGGASGTVMQQRVQDAGAWVRLDQRCEVADVHGFPADDYAGRGNDVLAYPEHCEDAGEVDRDIADAPVSGRRSG